MKECRFCFLFVLGFVFVLFLLREITIIQRKKKQMLLVTNNCFFHHVGCDVILVCFPKFKCIFFSSFDYCLFVLFSFVFSNESVCITTGDEAGDVCGGGYEKHTAACIYCTLWFGCAFPVCFCFVFFSFFLLFLSRESRKAVNFILRHCTVDQSCKYFTSTKNKPNKHYVL